jgi:hypothetical protein
MALTFNRSGSRLAAGLTDGNVWIWNTENIDDALVHARVPTGGGGAYAVVSIPMVATCLAPVLSIASIGGSSMGPTRKLLSELPRATRLPLRNGRR